MNDLTPLFTFLDEHEINFQVNQQKDLTPYYLIQLLEYDVTLHFIHPSESTKNWHQESSLIHVSNKLNTQRVIHLWYDVLTNHQEAVFSRLLGIFNRTTRIHARKLIVQRIDIHTLNKFIEENHINGSPKVKVKYGLFDQNKLVAVASFSGKRTINNRDGLKHQSYELIRYCNLNYHTVVGGLSKILKQFIKEYSPDDIMTYTDSDWSLGESFGKLGFEHFGSYPPFPFHWDPKTEKKLRLDVNESYFFKVYNAGSNKYILNLNRINN